MVLMMMMMTVLMMVLMMMMLMMMLMMMRSWSRYSSVAGIFDTPPVVFFRSMLFDTHHTHRIHTQGMHTHTHSTGFQDGTFDQYEG